MPIRRSNPPPDPTALLLDYCRAFFQVGANAYARALKIGAAYAKQTADGAALAKNESTPQVLGSYLFGLHNYYLEMATVLPLAIEGHLQKRSSLQDHQGTLQVAPTRASMHSVDGKPTLLPARITDASQGWAIYLVATDRAQAQLRSPSEFTVVDVGLGRTPVFVFAIDHRQSDLGTYQEIGLALYVRPHHNGSSLPGGYFLSLVVNETFTIDASRLIWGFHKTLARNMAIKSTAGHTTFVVDDHDPTSLAIAFPRFGRTRSTDIPCYIYSLSTAGKSPAVQRTIFSRSAVAEGLQIRGDVRIRLGDIRQKNCACRGNIDSCICSMLQALQLPPKPAANGWADLLSGSFSPPSPCT